LPEVDRRTVRLADGSRRELSKVSGLLLEILGRKMGSDAYVVPLGSRALVGQLQLEDLDLVVDARSRELRVNPESPDRPTGTLYSMGAGLGAGAGLGSGSGASGFFETTG